MKRLVYTSSIASIMPHDYDGYVFDLLSNPVVDESRETYIDKTNEHGYAATKRSTEKYLSYQAYISGGKWSVITGNPGDIIGPVLAKHQAAETWQGKIGGIIQGIPSRQEAGGRPWMLVDARDVAEAEILLAESKLVESGQRFLLSSGDKIQAEHIGERIMELYPTWDCATTVTPGPGAKKVVRNEPMWIRVNLRNERTTKAVGMHWHSFDDTMRDTVDTLVKVGGIQPRLKK